MAVWTVYLSLCLLFALSGAEEIQHRRAARHICRNCPAEWSEYKCRCFKFFNTPVTWIEAEKTCLSSGSNLASVTDHEEYIFIQSLIRRLTHNSPRTWLGGNDGVSENSWLWSNGKQMTFKLWAPGEPSNSRGHEHCLEMNFGETKNWNDLNCSNKRPFVCGIN